MANNWTTANIPDQRGRRFVITGANSGIGYEAALELARHNAGVVLAVRTPQKGEAAAKKIRAQVGGAQVSVAELDLASLQSVADFAALESQNGKPLDVLINNGAVMAPKQRGVTADGFELQFGTNVLGHFALTAMLLPKLLARAQAAQEMPRVVWLASIAHKQGKLHFDDLQFAQKYNAWAAYQQSKLACLMLAFEMDRRLQSHGDAARLLSVGCHPGVAGTNLIQAQGNSKVEKMARAMIEHTIGVFLNSGAQGALPTLFAATAAQAKSGGYYGPQGFQETRGGDVGPAKISPQALDTDAAARLWRVCEELTGAHMLD